MESGYIFRLAEFGKSAFSDLFFFFNAANSIQRTLAKSITYITNLLPTLLTNHLSNRPLQQIGLDISSCVTLCTSIDRANEQIAQLNTGSTFCIFGNLIAIGYITKLHVSSYTIIFKS